MFHLSYSITATSWLFNSHLSIRPLWPKVATLHWGIPWGFPTLQRPLSVGYVPFYTHFRTTLSPTQLPQHSYTTDADMLLRVVKKFSANVNAQTKDNFVFP